MKGSNTIQIPTLVVENIITADHNQDNGKKNNQYKIAINNLSESGLFLYDM